jgi:hypothetical protein
MKRGMVMIDIESGQCDEVDGDFFGGGLFGRRATRSLRVKSFSRWIVYLLPKQVEEGELSFNDMQNKDIR